MQLVEHLTSLGHKRIAYLSGVGPEERRTVCDRVAGYVLGHEKAGLPLRGEFIITDMVESLRQGSTAGDPGPLGERIKSLMKQGITAIMAEHDELAFQILMVCKDLNISVPRDLSVCGFDDSEWAHMLPGATTTVRQDQERIGKHVAEILLDRVGGAVKPAQNIVVPTKLMVGTTTGECPKNGK
jgi:LacI family transcriptional regulator